jgi:hypothetical protein
MSFFSQIGVNLDQLSQNIARLQEQAATMPDLTDVRQVDGAQTEPAQDQFRTELVQIAGMLAQRTQTVRKYVEKNAQAFERAAADLQETDGADSLAARQADAFVQAIVATPPSPTPGAPAAPATQPGTGATAW